MKKITIEQAKKVLEVVDAGLTRGLGSPEPGRMCVEAAVCFALGEPHGDEPACVAAAYAAAADAAAYAADAYAYAAADAAYATATATADAILTISAGCCLDALRAVNAPGIALLDELGI